MRGGVLLFCSSVLLAWATWESGPSPPQPPPGRATRLGQTRGGGEASGAGPLPPRSVEQQATAAGVYPRAAHTVHRGRGAAQAHCKPINRKVGGTTTQCSQGDSYNRTTAGWGTHTPQLRSRGKACSHRHHKHNTTLQCGCLPMPCTASTTRTAAARSQASNHQPIQGRGGRSPTHTTATTQPQPPLDAWGQAYAQTGNQQQVLPQTWGTPQQPSMQTAGQPQHLPQTGGHPQQPQASTHHQLHQQQQTTPGQATVRRVTPYTVRFPAPYDPDADPWNPVEATVQNQQPMTESMAFREAFHSSQPLQSPPGGHQPPGFSQIPPELYTAAHLAADYGFLLRQHGSACLPTRAVGGRATPPISSSTRMANTNAGWDDAAALHRARNTAGAATPRGMARPHSSSGDTYDRRHHFPRPTACNGPPTTRGLPTTALGHNTTSRRPRVGTTTGGGNTGHHGSTDSSTAGQMGGGQQTPRFREHRTLTTRSQQPRDPERSP